MTFYPEYIIIMELFCKSMKGVYVTIVLLRSLNKASSVEITSRKKEAGVGRAEVEVEKGVRGRE